MTRRSSLLLPLFVTTALGLAAPVHAGDPNPGRALHDRQCTSCHGSEVYTRDNRRVQSLQALQGQVERCRNNLELEWFDDQTSSVVDYLNQSYYKF